MEKKPYKVLFDFNGQARADQLINGSSIASQVYLLLNKVKRTYEWDQMKLKEYEGTLNDLEHAIEAAADHNEIRRIAKRIQDVRVRRRILLYERKQLVDFYNAITGTKMIDTVRAISSSVDKEKDSQSKMKYWCRDDKNDTSISDKMGEFYSSIQVAYASKKKTPEPQP
jgi:hypothetical protein